MSTMTATRAPEEAAEAEKEPRSKKKLLVVVGVVLALAGGGYWFFLKPSAPEEPKPGEIVQLDSTQVNLAAGHYLKIGLALQAVEGAEEVNGSKALDAAIDLFSGRAMDEISAAKERRHLKEELQKELDHLYEGEVIDVYFTEYVTQ